MNTYIRCNIATVNDKQMLEFYAVKGGSSYFLFNQRYYRSSYDYFRNNVPVSDALDFSKMHRNTAMTNVVRRLASSIKYAEKYYSISLLERKARPAGRDYADYDLAAGDERDDCLCPA